MILAGSSITEKWEYKTDIITSYNGSEQRLQLLQYPRHYLSYDYPAMDCFQAQWLRGLARMRQSDTYYIPMWHTPVYLRTSHIAGRALYIDYDCMMSLHECEWIEIFKHDDPNQGTANKVYRVREYLDGIIGLRDPINFPMNKKNTWIFPLKKCSVQPISGLQYIWSNGTNVTHNFEDILWKPTTVHIPDKYLSDYEDYPQRNRWNLPETYNGKQVLQIPPQWVEDNSNTLSVEKAVTRIDNETGGFLYDLRNSSSYDIHTLELTLMNKKSINNMIRFFKRVKGRYKSFYAPTWVNDVQILEDMQANLNYVYTDWNKISDFYLGNTRKKHLVVFTKDWNCHILQILTYGYDTLPSGKKRGKVIFTSNIGFDLPTSNILMASYFNLVRLDSDELQLNYESNIVANTTLVMKEVDDI